MVYNNEVLIKAIDYLSLFLEKQKEFREAVAKRKVDYPAY
jgi:hypothetical protein